VRPEGFDDVVRRLDWLGNRIVLGLAMLTSVYRPPGWDQFVGIVFGLGFFVSAALGIHLAVAIFRSGGA
jgi:ubiquinone biosynthesis protein